jgi:hypothetical protein
LQRQHAKDREHLITACQAGTRAKILRRHPSLHHNPTGAMATFLREKPFHHVVKWSNFPFNINSKSGEKTLTHKKAATKSIPLKAPQRGRCRVCFNNWHITATYRNVYDFVHDHV